MRKDQIKPWGGPKDSGVSGDPTKATAEIGTMGIEFKVNAGLAQYRLIKNPPRQRPSWIRRCFAAQALAPPVQAARPRRARA